MKLHLAKIGETTLIERAGWMTQREKDNVLALQQSVYRLVRKVIILPSSEKKVEADKWIAIILDLHGQVLERVDNLEEIAREYARVQYRELSQ